MLILYPIDFDVVEEIWDTYTYEEIMFARLLGILLSKFKYPASREYLFDYLINDRRVLNQRTLTTMYECSGDVIILKVRITDL